MSFTKDRFEEIFQSKERIQGLTHDFYKYPARFSPKFARFILDEFSEPGDWVLDPFMGGGTTIVESLASGRRVIGSDINELARFVTRVKTTPLSSGDVSEIRSWVECVNRQVADSQHDGRLMRVTVRNLPIEVTLFFEIAIKFANRLAFRRRRMFARCALVRVGQWGLDARTFIPSISELCDELEKCVERMIQGLDDLVSSARLTGTNKNKITSLRQLRAYSAANAGLAYNLSRKEIKPKLVLTSPPYPGVHVLYHRWQILGRRETPAPYWIASLRDGHGEAYYTMGGRSESGLRNYFNTLAASFENLHKMIHPDAYIVQLVSFSDVKTHLPIYLEAIEKTGFKEESGGSIESRQIRDVPNRKWYNQGRPANDASREMLLVHRPKT